MEAALHSSLAPTHLELVDESHLHAKRATGETHFKIVIAAEAFRGRSRVERHRLVHAALQAELAAGLHALTTSAFSPEEWAASPVVLASPDCPSGPKPARGPERSS